MKKIIFVAINMSIGGTEKALLSLLKVLCKKEYEITLLLLEAKGELLKEVPPCVKVIDLKEYKSYKPLIKYPFKYNIKMKCQTGKWKEAVYLFALYLRYKMKGERTSLYSYLLKESKEIEETYDIAVAFAGPMEFISYFVAYHIKARKKVQWIHFDITSIAFSIPFARKVYRAFDKIFVVSKEGRSKLVSVLPKLASKIEVFLNIVNEEEIKKLGMVQLEEMSLSSINLVTVGRLSMEKGQFRCIEAVARLKEEGYKVKWYAVGDGPSRKDYETLARKLKVEEECIFIGATTNPYPFMRQADIYIQPSSYEGYCITLAEAKLFNHPIITTDFIGAKEQIEEGKTGFIVEMSSEAIFKAVKRLIDKPFLYNEMSKALGYKSRGEVQQAYKLNRILDE